MWHYIYVRFYNEIRFVLKLILWVLLIAMVAAMFTGCYAFTSINDDMSKAIEERCDGSTTTIYYRNMQIECPNVSEETYRRQTQIYIEASKIPNPETKIRWIGDCVVTDVFYPDGNIQTIVNCY